jgi:hypothetical protein
MSIREARREIVGLKETILSRFPGTVLREGPGFDGGPKDIFLYAYTDEDKRDAIREMSSPRVLKILLKTGILVHVIPLRPGTMTWLWDHRKKRRTRRPTRARAESRAAYKVGKSKQRKSVRKNQNKEKVNDD